MFLSGSGILAQRGTGHVCDHMTIALATVVTIVAKNEKILRRKRVVLSSSG